MPTQAWAWHPRTILINCCVTEYPQRPKNPAAEEGVLPGGGVALLRCDEAVQKARGNARGDEKIGVDIIARALSAPIRQIADNCGVDGSVIADEVGGKSTNTGYDANAGKYTDMLKAGIIDPLKVVRTALENAASIAGLMLTTATLVTDMEADDKGKQLAEGIVR
jgi:chaperonin GroEL